MGKILKEGAKILKEGENFLKEGENFLKEGEELIFKKEIISILNRSFLSQKAGNTFFFCAFITQEDKITI